MLSSLIKLHVEVVQTLAGYVPAHSKRSGCTLVHQALESERAAMEAARAALDKERQTLAAAPLPIVQATPPPPQPQPQQSAVSATVQGSITQGSMAAAPRQPLPQQMGSVGATPVAPAAAAGNVPVTLPPAVQPGQT
jgi:hypothetical protein